MKVWPFYPMKDVGENFSWVTDVVRTVSVESRVSARAARRSFTYRYSKLDLEFSKAAAYFETDFDSYWLVPIWTESDVVDVLSTDTVILCNTDANYSDKAIIYKGCSNYAVVDIESIIEGEITLSEPVGEDFTNALICPLSVCFSLGGLESSRDHVRAANIFEIVFEEIDYAAPEGSIFEQHSGLDVVTSCLAVAQMQTRRAGVFVVSDNISGRPKVTSRQDKLTNFYSARFVYKTEGDRWNNQLWLNSIRGRDKPFWVNGWIAEMTLSVAIVSTDTSILIDPLLENISDYVGRAIMIDDGSEKTVRTVTAATVAGGDHRLFVTALGRDIAPGARINFLRKVRLSNDTFSIEHKLRFAAQANIEVTEILE